MGNKKANLTEEQVTEITLSSLKENPEGVTEYPILEFDDRALRLLSSGVAETLRYSEVKPRGGLGYRFVKRLFDIVVSALGLILLAIPMGVVALVIYLDDKGSPIFSQARLTENGKVFRMHKFRSMVRGCGEEVRRGAEGERDRRAGVQERERSTHHQDRAVHPQGVHRRAAAAVGCFLRSYVDHRSPAAASERGCPLYAAPDAAADGKRRSVLHLPGRGQK